MNCHLYGKQKDLHTSICSLDNETHLTKLVIFLGLDDEPIIMHYIIPFSSSMIEITIF